MSLDLIGIYLLLKDHCRAILYSEKRHSASIIKYKNISAAGCAVTSPFRSWFSLQSIVATNGALIGLTGCSATTVVTNSEKISPQENAYSLATTAEKTNKGKTAILVSFSGGGTRAAALSYGVLKGMRDYEITGEGLTESKLTEDKFENKLTEDKSEASKNNYRLIDQISTISSVSGGSFTAAYYGLYKDQIFEDYEDDFLYKDVSGNLVDMILSPTFWFSKNTRTAAASNLYNQTLFNNATFADMNEDSPRIIINSTDLGGGVRFSFLQEYFDLICSDVNDYSVSNAVMASSAVPIIFPPVVLENYDKCGNRFLIETPANTEKVLPIHLNATRVGIASYADKDKRPYIHLVDGGITDNLGLMAIYDVVKEQEEAFEYLSENIDTIIVISVDASTKPEWNIDDKKETPTTYNVIGAATDIQLHRYNDLVKSLVVKELGDWEDKDQQRKAYFIDINLSTSQYPNFMNNIPTDFTLKQEQADELIKHGYDEIINDEQLAEIYQHQVKSEFKYKSLSTSKQTSEPKPTLDLETL